MSDWKVSKEKIELFNHSNADALEIGKVGSYQVVVQKGLYNDGDEVIFAPEKSILSGQLREEFKNYLVGPVKDRVKGVRLRGEVSSGILVPKHLIEDISSYEIGVDISSELGITKYEPPIPVQLAGQVKPFEMDKLGKHDCEQVGIYINQLVQGERVIISEKVHGSQNIIAHDIDKDETIVSSKGMFKKGLCIEFNPDNSYWAAVMNNQIIEKIRDNFDDGIVQVFGEVVPVQGGYSYGKTKPNVLVFDVRHNGVSIPYDKCPQDFLDIWVPIVYDGELKMEEKVEDIYRDDEKGIHKTKTIYSLPKDIIKMSKGKELVSGKGVHIKEGVVIRPYIDRKAKDGKLLRLKLINPAYKETGEEIN